jgi:hypothetical protein
MDNQQSNDYQSLLSGSLEEASQKWNARLAREADTWGRVAVGTPQTAEEKQAVARRLLEAMRNEEDISDKADGKGNLATAVNHVRKLPQEFLEIIAYMLIVGSVPVHPW